ncbi:MAG: TolC family protein, partial [Cyclobacteriaceae bacterium]|nr:TolC family protein [Cyclobacteriaceae bacterium]
VLYAMFDRKGHHPQKNVRPAFIVTLLLVCLSFVGNAQTKEISVEQAVQIALSNNLGLKASSHRIEQSKQLIGSAIDIDKTQVYYNYDQNNIAPNNLPLNVWGIQQTLAFPTVYGAKRKKLKSQSTLVEDQYKLDQYMVAKEVSKAYYEVIYRQQLVTNYYYLDSLYSQFSIAATRKFEEGESNYLEKITAETKQREISILLKQSEEGVEKSYIHLQQWLQSDSTFIINNSDRERLPFKPLDSIHHPGIHFYNDAQLLSQNNLSLEKQQLLPDLQFSVFQGTNNGANPTNYTGFQAGVAIPLWLGAHKSKINAAKTAKLIVSSEAKNYQANLKSTHQSLLSDLKQYEQHLDYYENTGKKLAEELILHAVKAFKSGEIDFLQYVQLLENAKTIEINYLNSLFQYNMAVLEANYLTNY